MFYEYYNSMKQFLRSNHSAGKEIPCLFWNKETYYHFHKILLLTPNLSQMYFVHTLPPYVFMLHYNIILPCQSQSQVWMEKEDWEEYISSKIPSSAGPVMVFYPGL